jgi:hypothetical protein
LDGSQQALIIFDLASGDAHICGQTEGSAIRHLDGKLQQRSPESGAISNVDQAVVRSRGRRRVTRFA